MLFFFSFLFLFFFLFFFFLIGICILHGGRVWNHPGLIGCYHMWSLHCIVIRTHKYVVYIDISVYLIDSLLRATALVSCCFMDENKLRLPHVRCRRGSNLPLVLRFFVGRSKGNLIYQKSSSPWARALFIAMLTLMSTQTAYSRISVLTSCRLDNKERKPCVRVGGVKSVLCTLGKSEPRRDYRRRYSGISDCISTCLPVNLA
jgi:hypothetical protein